MGVSSSASVGKRRESSREVRRVSNVRLGMLLLGCASRDALVRWLSWRADRTLDLTSVVMPDRCNWSLSVPSTYCAVVATKSVLCHLGPGLRQSGRGISVLSWIANLAWVSVSWADPLFVLSLSPPKRGLLEMLRRPRERPRHIRLLDWLSYTTQAKTTGLAEHYYSGTGLVEHCCSRTGLAEH
ncbi:hypothetical protein BHE74_00038190 [Ensete ventricosum]|nr:hypothetical protein BHE74_00038190 [Ensete ventricosum]